MRVAFVYLTEPHQCFHTAAVAHEMAQTGGCTVEMLYNDPACVSILQRIATLYPDSNVPTRPLARSFLDVARPLLPPRMRSLKLPILWRNRRLLNSFDAIVVPERTSTILRRMGVDRPRLIHIPHGVGDRAKGFEPRLRLFDFVLPGGPKDAARMLDMGLITPANHVVPGYVKLETVRRLTESARQAAPLFANDRPVVLYNPHFDLALSSWTPCARAVVAAFEAQDRYNLIFAPHIRLFADAPAHERHAWQSLAVPDKILVDLGSERLIDMTYTMAADVYLGDVSSQVYEFIATPRPCLFINAHGVTWQHDPNYAHWQLGPVVTPDQDIVAAVDDAIASHASVAERQRQRAWDAFGDVTPGVGARAATAICKFLSPALLPDAQAIGMPGCQNWQQHPAKLMKI